MPFLLLFLACSVCMDIPQTYANQEKQEIIQVVSGKQLAASLKQEFDLSPRYY